MTIVRLFTSLKIVSSNRVTAYPLCLKASGCRPAMPDRLSRVIRWRCRAVRRLQHPLIVAGEARLRVCCSPANRTGQRENYGNCKKCNDLLFHRVSFPRDMVLDRHRGWSLRYVHYVGNDPRVVPCITDSYCFPAGIPPRILRQRRRRTPR